MAGMKPNSATDGFFQEQPKLGNQYEDDMYLQRILKGYLPSEYTMNASGSHAPIPILQDLGAKIITPEIFRNLHDAETHKPYVEELTTFGKPKGVLHTSEGWKYMGRMAAREGIIQSAFEGHYGSWCRVVQFAKYYIYSPSTAIYTCPLAMTDAAARVLELQLKNQSLPSTKRSIFQEAYENLTTRDPSKCWTSGQWMTERAGGSDVRNSETTAFQQSDGTYLVSGHKWFSSATDSQMTIMLARTPTSAGLSCFFAPLKFPDGTWNGVRIVRLKDKLGTKALPTAELELKDMKAYLVGEEGKGIKYISTMLNVTRVHNAVSAVSFFRRGLAIAKAFAKVRKVQNKELWKNPLHLGGLSKLEVIFRANMQLTFFALALLGFDERGMPSQRLPWMPKDATHTNLLLRVITPLVKMATAKATVNSLAECMECLGGVGYLENEPELNIARLYRDANVLPIWEGTTNVLSVDVIRAFTKGDSLGAMDTWLVGVLNKPARDSLTEARSTLAACWSEVKNLVKGISMEETLARSRDISFTISFIMMGALLIQDADRDNDPLAIEVTIRWILEGIGREGFQAIGASSFPNVRRTIGWKERAEIDCRIVFGHGLQASSKL